MYQTGSRCSPIVTIIIMVPLMSTLLSITSMLMQESSGSHTHASGALLVQRAPQGYVVGVDFSTMITYLGVPLLFV